MRIIPHRAGAGCDVQFDDPYSDGHDWIGRSHGFIVLIDKNDAQAIDGSIIDVQGDEFRVTYA